MTELAQSQETSQGHSFRTARRLPRLPEFSSLPGLAQSYCLLMVELLFAANGAAYWGSGPNVMLLAQNAWETQRRDNMLMAWALLSVTLSLLFVGAAWRKQDEALRRIADRLLPIIPISLLPFLLSTDHFRHRPLTFLVLLGIFGFVTEACFYAAFKQSKGLLDRLSRLREGTHRLVPWLPWAIVLSAAGGYALYTGYLTVLNHHRFGTGAFDLGIFNNVMFNSYKGHPFRTTIMLPTGSQSFLLCHSPYLVYLLMPFYALFPTAETLLWCQAGLLGSGAIFLFLFARTQVTAGVAAVFSLLYLLFAPMHGAQFYDFHWLTIASPFLLFLLYALATARPFLILLSTLLCWLLREDLAPGLALLGAILIVSGKRPRAGVFLVVGSGIWFAINKFIIMPSFGTWWFANLYGDLTTPTEKGYGSAMKTLINNPVYVLQTLLKEGKFIYLMHMVAPLALVPIRRPSLAILLLPGALFTVLTNAGANFSIRYQYSSHYAAYLFLAVTVYFASELRKERARAGADPLLRSRARGGSLLVALCACTICHSATFGVVLAPKSFIGGAFPIEFSLSEKEKQTHSAFDELRSLIPREATVTSTTKDAPHLSNRLNIYAFSHSRHPSEYLLINPSSFGMGSTNQDILAALDQAPYGLVRQVRGITLWKKNHSSPETKRALERLRRKLGGKRPRRH